MINEKKDACYSKVKSRYSVWPSAYASGALVKCRKVGAKNWGNKSKKTNESLFFAYADVAYALVEMREKTPSTQRVKLDNARKKAFQAAHRGEGRRSKSDIMRAYSKRENQINARQRAIQRERERQDEESMISELAVKTLGSYIRKALKSKKDRTKGVLKAYKKGEQQEVDEAKSAAWQRKEGKNPEGGLNKKGVASYRAANPGSKLKTAVTTKPSKLKKGSKAANRRKSFCARMSGMKKRLTSAKTANDPDSRINKSLRKWNC